MTDSKTLSCDAVEATIRQNIESGILKVGYFQIDSNVGVSVEEGDESLVFQWFSTSTLVEKIDKASVNLSEDVFLRARSRLAGGDVEDDMPEFLRRQAD